MEAIVYIFGIAFLVGYFYCCKRIFERIGWNSPEVFALGMCTPASIFIIIFLGLGKWPIEDEFKELKKKGITKDTQDIDESQLKHPVEPPLEKDDDAYSFCPKCKAQYKEGFDVCSDCNIDLVKF